MILPRTAAWLGLLVLASFLPLRPAHGESACPPGRYQATPPGIPGPVVCAPIPHDRNGRVLAPPPRADHWGAIASDATTVHVAASINLPSKQEAEQAALASCRKSGGHGCRVVVAYGNGCGALVAGDRGLTSGADVTSDFARQGAMRQCLTDGGGHCQVVHVACSDLSSNH